MSFDVEISDKCNTNLKENELGSVSTPVLRPTLALIPDIILSS